VGDAIQDVTDPTDPSTFLFQQAISWPGKPRPEDLPDQAAKVAFIRETARAFAEPWRSAGLNVPPDVDVVIDPIEMWAPDRDWTASALWPRVTLAGDAAHNTPPFRGQGLNNAFQDAEKLVSELVRVVRRVEGEEQQTLSQAVRAYEEEMKARNLKEMEVSLLQSRTAHDWETLLQMPMFKAGMNAYREEKTAPEEGD
jgi:2-polyprenyl-6-methoxyphenol hydroxylase-like FAD-dependent oxidoreductase